MLFPRMLFQAILLMMIIGVIAFCGVRGLERDPLAASIDIAVVVQEDNRMTQMALAYVENMESVSSYCHFQQTTEEEGFDLLRKGKIAVLVLLPEQLVEGIMNGRNPSVDIYFPRNARLEAMLFRELTESGEGLLRAAQAQIYGANDTASAYGLQEQLSKMEAEIDSYNLAFALDRMALFDTEQVSVFGSMNVVQFYAASGAVLFLLLTGMALYPVMQREPTAIRKQLERQGTGSGWQCFSQWFCAVLCMGLLLAVLWMGVKLAYRWLPDGFLAQIREDRADSGFLLPQIMLAGLIVLSAVTIVYFIYSLTGSRTSGILLLFLVSVVMVYLSGGLAPSMFMPERMQAADDLSYGGGGESSDRKKQDRDFTVCGDTCPFYRSVWHDGLCPAAQRRVTIRRKVKDRRK